MKIIAKTSRGHCIPYLRFHYIIDIMRINKKHSAHSAFLE